MSLLLLVLPLAGLQNLPQLVGELTLHILVVPVFLRGTQHCLGLFLLPISKLRRGRERGAVFLSYKYKPSFICFCPLVSQYSKLSARIYRPSFGHENASFRENMPKMLVFIPIRAQRRRYRLVLEEIRLEGGFQILELRRGRDQLVFMPKEQPY